MVGAGLLEESDREVAGGGDAAARVFESTVVSTERLDSEGPGSRGPVAGRVLRQPLPAVVLIATPRPPVLATRQLSDLAHLTRR